MLRRFFVPAALSAALFVPAGVFAAPATPTAPAATPAASAARPALAADRVEGKVTVVDAPKRLITLTTRFGQVSKTLTVADNAKITRVTAGTVSDLKAGDHIRAYGSATAQSPTLTATRIMETAAPAARARKARPNAGFHKKSVEGVVATASPNLTLTTPGGVTVTVNTTSATKVTTVVPATLADVTAGAQVQARLSAPGSATVTELRIQPAARRHGKSGKKAKVK